jgi:hypothetical protein
MKRVHIEGFYGYGRLWIEKDEGGGGIVVENQTHITWRWIRKAYPEEITGGMTMRELDAEAFAADIREAIDTYEERKAQALAEWKARDRRMKFEMGNPPHWSIQEERLKGYPTTGNFRRDR